MEQRRGSGVTRREAYSGSDSDGLRRRKSPVECQSILISNREDRRDAGERGALIHAIFRKRHPVGTP